MLIALFTEFKSSIKSPDTEEKIDLLIYRPFGYLIAKLARPLGMTPSMLSILGLVFGVLSAFYFLETGNKQALVLASLYFVLSGIFDSSDGQLARLSNQSSKIGLILDGICDSLVTIAIYLACSWPYLKMYGPLFLLVVVVALHLHSCQCAILDFYHREYLFFGYGKTENDTYWNPGVKDGITLINKSPNKMERFMNSLRLTWIKKQQGLTTRSDEERYSMRELLLKSNETEKEHFMHMYKKHNRWLLPFWRLVGVNAHTILIILFMFTGRFDLYLVAVDIVFLNLVVFAVGILQTKEDQKFYTAINLNTHAK